jgi:hypothetical protein
MSALFDHTHPLLGIKQNNQNEDKEAIYQRMIKGLELEDLEGERAKQAQFRDKVEEIFFKEKKIATDAMRAGFSVNGTSFFYQPAITWCKSDPAVFKTFFPAGAVCTQTGFKLVPISVLRILSFAKQGITEEDLFDEHGEFRFILFTYALGEEEINTIEHMRNSRTLFQSTFKSFLRSKIGKEEPYLQQLFHMWTGQNYIPYDGFRTTIEFNARDDKGKKWNDTYLPYFHICPNIMVIPPNAYDGNMQMFAERLETIFEHVQDYFTML